MVIFYFKKITDFFRKAEFFGDERKFIHFGWLMTFFVFAMKSKIFLLKIKYSPDLAPSNSSCSQSLNCIFEISGRHKNEFAEGPLKSVKMIELFVGRSVLLDMHLFDRM